MTFFSRQPKISNNSTNSTPYIYMLFEPLILKNLRLTLHFAHLPLGNLTIYTAKYVQNTYQ